MLPGVVLVAIGVVLSIAQVHRERQWAWCARADFEKKVEVSGIVVRSSRGLRVIGGMPAQLYLKPHRDIRPGTMVRLQVMGRCLFPFRNRSARQDGLYRLSLPVFYGRIVSHDRTQGRVLDRVWETLFQSRELFWDWMDRRLSHYPTLRALSRASWFADQSLLSHGLRRSVSEWGITHAVALSGQHVAVVLFMVSILLRPIMHLAPVLIPPLAHLGTTAVLCMTSLFTPSVVRVFVLVFFHHLLSWRGIFLGPKRVVLWSIVFLASLNPHWLATPAFWLSGVGSYAILQGGVVLGVFFVGVVMPVLMVPWLIFFFGQFSILSPFVGAFIAMMWEWTILPLGLVAPFFPGKGLLEFSEWGSYRVLDLFARWSNFDAIVHVPRPTWIELCALVCLGLIAWNKISQIYFLRRV